MTRARFDSPPAVWEPILPDGLRQAAKDSITAIAHAVRAGGGKLESKHASAPPHERALFYGYLSYSDNDEEYAELAVSHLNRAIERVQTRPIRLHGGLCGVAWTIEHLTRLLGEAGDDSGGDTEASEDVAEDLNEETDSVLLRQLAVPEWTHDYDLIGGLVGVGVYLLERLPRESAARGLNLVIDRLESEAEHTKSGITWHTRPELLPPWQRESNPNGYYNLGVAHGVPGVIYLLTEALTHGFVQPRVESLLEGSVDWLLAQEKRSSSCWYASRLNSRGESTDLVRLAWCYGDLGVTAVLLQAAIKTQNVSWYSRATDMLHHCLTRPDPLIGIQDACLCHGAVGNAHVFNRIYQYTGDSRCREAAIDWYRWALAMRQEEAGAGGFLAYKTIDRREMTLGYVPATNLLEGAIGVALALQSAVTTIAPEWDRLLALSGRAPSGTGSVSG